MGKCKKFYFFVFVSHIYKRRTVFLQGVEGIFLFLCKKIAIRLHFLKSYSFAIDNIELLLVLIIRIIFQLINFSQVHMLSSLYPHVPQLYLLHQFHRH